MQKRRRAAVGRRSEAMAGQALQDTDALARTTCGMKLATDLSNKTEQSESEIVSMDMDACHFRLLAGFGRDLPGGGRRFKSSAGACAEAAARIGSHRRVSTTNQLRLAIGLPLRDPDGLQKFLAQVYDPASTNYHHYLSPQEFTERFGATAADYQMVKEFARTNGLSITATHPNRMLLDVEGPVGKIEQAFHVKLMLYHHPTEGRDFFVPDREPSVNAQLPISDVSGLQNFSRPRPAVSGALIR